MSLQKESEIDYLNNDIPIPGQNFVCLSFLSPENVLKNKQLFDFYNFLKENDSASELEFDKFSENFKTYLQKESDSLSIKFSENHGMTTSIRGLKIRGVYDSLNEAQYRAKSLQKRDPNFNEFVGQVGFWLPWDPDPQNIKHQEYANQQLNELMKNYNENQEKKDQFYEENKAQLIKKNIEENMKKKEMNKNLMGDSDTWLEHKTSK